jgi:hypothetical protein
MFLLSVALLAVLAVACGSGDKKSESTGDDKPTATAEASNDSDEKSPKPRATADTEDDPTEEASGDPDVGDGIGGGDAIGSLFGSVFQNGLSGSGSASGSAGTGDESLKALLPEESDFPEGYFNLGAFSFSAPAGSSEFGAMDMAMTMAMKGDPSTFAGADPSSIDFSQIEMLMAMVLKPEDFQALGEAFDDIKNLDEDEIQDEIDSSLGGMEGFEVKRFDVLDVEGLGEGAFGIEMSMDMSGLGTLFGGLGGGDAPALTAMTMRMYIFGRGDYAGAVMRIAFADTLDGGSEDIDIAEIIDANLEAAS